MKADAESRSARRPPRAKTLAVVVTYGNADGSFFSEAFEGRLVIEARDLGLEATLVRVVYEGSPESDAAISARLSHLLHRLDVDVVLAGRLFDPSPVLAHRDADPARRFVLLALGEHPPALDGVDYVLGTRIDRGGVARRELAPDDQMLDAFEALVRGLARGEDPDVAGVARVVDGRYVAADVMPAPRRRRPYRVALDVEVIAPFALPPSRRRTLVGTHGCPHALDAMASPHFEGVALPAHLPVAREGCSFCPMGGDYVAGTDAAIVESLLEQASFHLEHEPDVTSFVLSDQHPLRYLARLVEEAAARGLRPVRWLFAARADALVRERASLDAAVAAAERSGAVVESYLTGFESFSDAELVRYNKGLRAQDLLDAVALLRAVHAAHPTAFEFASSRGHSLILFGPWTSLEDLRITVDTVRRERLREVFHDLGRNRLRLYPNLPIYYAAARDGLLAEAWDEAGSGTARDHGYGEEVPWRFLDARTRMVFVLSRVLREARGLDDEAAQLCAAADFAGADGAPLDAPTRAAADVRDGLAALGEAVVALGAGGRPRARTLPASFVELVGACNNGCAGCTNREYPGVAHGEVRRLAVEAARRRAGLVVLAGREPTLADDFLPLVQAARGDDARPVAVVTNGRRFAYEHFARAASSAGIRVVSMKAFGTRAEHADAYTRVAGSFDQALAGAANLRNAGVTLEWRVVAHAQALDDLASAAELAARFDVARILVELPLDAIGLANLRRAADSLARLGEEASRRGIPLEVEATPANRDRVRSVVAPRA